MFVLKQLSITHSNLKRSIWFGVFKFLLKRVTETLDNWSKFIPKYKRLYYPNEVRTSPGQVKPEGNKPSFHFGKKVEM